MTVPVFQCDMAFGSNPTDASYNWQQIHRDDQISRVMSFTYARGRQNELNRNSTGGGQVQIGDANSDFDPANPTGRYSASVRPNVPIRIRATIGGTTYSMFTHYVDKWPRTKRIGTWYTERGITTVDGFDWLARAGLAGASYAAEQSGTRVGHALDTASWPAVLRSIDAGSSPLQAKVFAATDSTNTLSHLQDVAEWENGLLFIDADGEVKFVSRLSLITGTFYSTAQATFHDAVAQGAGYVFSDGVPVFDNETTFNQWIGTRNGGGTTQTWQDATSIIQNGPRTKTFTSDVTTDSEVLSAAQYKTARFGRPFQRYQSITIKPGSDAGAWAAVLGLDIGMLIVVREQPPGYQAPVQTAYTIQSLSVTVPTAQTAATFVFGLWPSQSQPWMLLDNGVLGKLDTGALAY